MSPPISAIYSSPYYRCIETVVPFARQTGHKIRVDRGLGEFHSKAPWVQPTSAPRDVLDGLFPGVLDGTYADTGLVPSPYGETVREVHERVGKSLAELVRRADDEGLVSIVIATHAASAVAMARMLTLGQPPKDLLDGGIVAHTAGLCEFKRGKEMLGGWECKRLFDCTFLSSGEERGWSFEMFVEEESDTAKELLMLDEAKMTWVESKAARERL